MHMYIHAHTHTDKSCLYGACVCVCMYVCMYVCIQGNKYIRTRNKEKPCLCWYVYVCMYVCMYVSKETNISEHETRRSLVCICMCVYVCMYVCMFANEHTPKLGTARSFTVQYIHILKSLKRDWMKVGHDFKQNVQL